jgi:hypothetical protein
MCVFIIFLSDFKVHCIQEGKLLNPKNDSTIVNMPPPKSHKNIQVSNNMAQFYHSFIGDFIFIMAPIE